MRCHAQVGLRNGGRQRKVDCDVLAVGAEQVDRGGLLVTRVVAPQVVPLAIRHLGCVAADLIDRDVDHVHPHRVAGREDEAGEGTPPEDMRVQLHKAAMRGGLRGDILQLRQVIVKPLRERAGIAPAGEHEAWRDVEGVPQHLGIRPPGLGDRPHPILIGGDKCPFRRREGDVIQPARVLAVDANRPGDTKRYVHRSDEVLDIAAHLLRRERGFGGRIHGSPDVVREPRASHRRVDPHDRERSHSAPAPRIEAATVPRVETKPHGASSCGRCLIALTISSRLPGRAR